MFMCAESGQKETPLQRKRRLAAGKDALENRVYEESLGLCRCSTEDGVFLRTLYEGGCPDHPKQNYYG